MKRYILTSIALLPLLFSYSRAAQNWGNDGPVQSRVFSSDEGGTTSYLGVDVADVTTDRLGALRLKEEKGAEVTMVDQDAPAGKAGLREHDVILSINGTLVESAAQLRRMIHETPPGRVVTLGLSRDGQPMSVKVQLGDRHKEMSMYSNSKDFPVVMPNINVHVPEIDIPAINMVVVSQSVRSGLTVENITPQLGEFFGVKNGNGVLVRSVERGSRAEKAGFRAGDVIVKVNDQPVHDTSDFTHAVRSRDGKPVNVGVMRDRREQNLTLTVPEHKESGDLFEESWSDEPILNAERSLEMSELRDQLAKLRPETELAMQNARKAMEQAQKVYCDQQKKMLEQSNRQVEKQQHEFRHQQEMLQQRIEKMRQEYAGHWFEM
jgi:serine protease Do